MNISKLIQKWSGIDETSKIIIIADKVQSGLAKSIQCEEDFDIKIEYYSRTEKFKKLLESLRSLSDRDLLIVMLSYQSFVENGANRYFSPFDKPEGISAKYIFVRLEISKESFIEGLSTEKSLVYDKISQMEKMKTGKTVRVTNASGTDISFQIQPFTTCSHEITQNGGMAFLPPSETSSEVVTETAFGKIAIDITVGQLYHWGRLLGTFGLVQSPVILIVENGIITEIEGDNMALELKEKLFSLPVDCRKIVELGQGLSKMNPTGLIGVDESIIDSCHFGFGDGGRCGTHLDVVISNPSIVQEETDVIK